MKTEWDKLRTWEGSQSAAFEELTCQLASRETHLTSGKAIPPGSTFERVAAPDAGKECYWQLPDHSIHCWQAKFFQKLGESQINQIKQSFETAIMKHPNMQSYVVAVPLNRTDQRGRNKSEKDRWVDFVKCCNSAAKKRGRTVDIGFWGTTEIFERLSKKEHQGRKHFWFDIPELDIDHLRKTLEIAKIRAGRRYTPEAHVSPSIDTFLQTLRNPNAFHAEVADRIQSLAHAVSEQKSSPGPFSEMVTQLEVTCRHLEKLGSILKVDGGPLLIEEVLEKVGEVEKLLETVRNSIDLIEKEARQKEKDKASDFGRQYDSCRYYRYCWGKLSTSIREMHLTLDSRRIALAKGEPLLLVGEAGTGKTHLIIDTSVEHLKAGFGAVTILCQRISFAVPLHKLICQELDFPDRWSARELLGCLNSLAEATGGVFLIFFDALNESPVMKSIWEDHLASLLVAMKEFSSIRLCVSVRSIFVSIVLPDSIRKLFVRIEHQGFLGTEFKAIQAYFHLYKIELTTPPLDPEFGNPLFLKLFCESMNVLGLTSMPDACFGFVPVFDLLLEGINEKISKELGMDGRRKLVQEATYALAEAMVDRRSLPEVEARRIVEGTHKGQNDLESLFYKMIQEGLIMTVPRYSYDRKRGRSKVDFYIVFCYDRFTDHIIARQLISDSLKSNEGERFVKSVEKMIAGEEDLERNASLLEALTIVLPEIHGRELVELIPSTHPSKNLLIDILLRTACWRTGESFSKAGRKMIVASAKSDPTKFFSVALSCALVREHPLSASQLDLILRSMSMADRDLQWSNAVNRLWGGSDTVDS